MSQVIRPFPVQSPLGEIGALNSLGDRIHRRETLWQVERAWRPKGPLFEGQDDALAAPGPLARMQPFERLEADCRGSELTVGKHPMHDLRGQMEGMDVLSFREVDAAADGQRVRVAGAVIRRQGPGTAKGFCFVTLEDEMGVSSLILSPQVFHAHRLAVMHETFLLAEGILQNTDGTSSHNDETLSHSSLTGEPVPQEAESLHRPAQTP